MKRNEKKLKNREKFLEDFVFFFVESEKNQFFDHDKSTHTNYEYYDKKHRYSRARRRRYLR